MNTGSKLEAESVVAFLTAEGSHRSYKIYQFKVNKKKNNKKKLCATFEIKRQQFKFN